MAGNNPRALHIKMTIYTYERDKRINAILSGELEQMAETVSEAYTCITFSPELDIYALGATIDELYPTLSRSDRQRVKDTARRYIATNYNIR